MANSDDGSTEHQLECLRRALEAETRRRLDLQRQLDGANRHFEEFVSMAAHNLRESLREVAAFSQLMAETHAGRLDAGAGESLARIRDGAARMQALLADIVDYWATDAGELQSSRTEMEAVLCQALLGADRQIAERAAIVTHDAMPEVMGDFEILTRVLRHLIGNAIEYSGAPSPRVHISSRREDREWVFAVRDNGPGIEPAFHDRLFRVFKRLHGREHPGSGLGLAFCKKAVERHGGRVWMESAAGAGSTFYFTLPPAD